MADNIIGNGINNPNILAKTVGQVGAGAIPAGLQAKEEIQPAVAAITDSTRTKTDAEKLADVKNAATASSLQAPLKAMIANASTSEEVKNILNQNAAAIKEQDSDFLTAAKASLGINDTPAEASKTETGLDAPAPGLPSMQLPQAPYIPSLNGTAAAPDVEKAQKDLAEGYEDGKIKYEGKDVSEKSAYLGKLIEDKKAAKTKLGEGYDYQIKNRGTELVNEYIKQRTDLITEKANEELKKVKKDEIEKVYDELGDPKDDYAKESNNVGKLGNMDFNTAYTQFIDAENGLKAGDKDKVSDLSAKSNLANGMEDLGNKEIRSLSAKKGAIKQQPKETAANFNARVKEVQDKIDAVTKKITEVKQKKAEIEKAIEAKKTERQKQIDAIFEKETNENVKAVIEQRNKDITDIPNEKEVTDAKAAIEKGDVEGIKFDKEKIKDDSLLTRHTDEMKTLKKEKEEGLKNADIIINEFEAHKAGLDETAKADPSAKGPDSGDSSENLGDTIGKIVDTASKLGAMALQYKNFDALNKLGSAGAVTPMGVQTINYGGAAKGPTDEQLKAMAGLDATARNSGAKEIAMGLGAQANLQNFKNGVFPT